MSVMGNLKILHFGKLSVKETISLFLVLCAWKSVYPFRLCVAAFIFPLDVFVVDLLKIPKLFQPTIISAVRRQITLSQQFEYSNVKSIRRIQLNENNSNWFFHNISTK